MSKTVIKIENLSKIYRLGEVGTGTLSHDLNRWFHMNLLGQDDPYAKVGHINDRTQKAEKGELVAALRDINLEVKEGEVLGIIGRNGAGKSTLLKLLSRVTSPTTGSIKVKGRLASLLEVGTGFHPEMTGRENIYMNGTIMGMRKWEIDKKMDEIVEFAGVAKYIDTPVKRYSSGMTVRLGFAVAAHLEPEILVVDEVLAVGDAEFQKKAIGKMQDVSTNDGRTVLFVSHNLGTIRTLCSRTIMLQNGILEYNGNTDDALRLYTTSSAIIHFNPNRRTGNQNITITNITLRRLNDNTISNCFQSGDGLLIEYQIKANIENLVGKQMQLGAQIYNSKGLFVTALNNMTQGTSITLKNSNQTVKCIIQKLPLTNGRHFINIGLIVDGILNDYIEEAVSFDVTPADYFGSGYSKLENREGVYIDHEWI